MSGEVLLSIIERIENRHEAKREIEEDVREIYAEAKANGFDTKAIREIVKRRAKDPDARSEFESIVDLYEREIEAASRAHAGRARENTEIARRAHYEMGDAADTNPIARTPENGHVDRSASARPLKAEGADGHHGITQPALEPLNFETPSGAETGSAVRTGAPNFEAA